jgi:hypothetical protein
MHDVDVLDDLHLTDRAVAAFTANARSEVRLVTEEDKIWQVDHSLPWDRFAPIPIAEHLLNLFTVCGDDLVAAHAALN